MLYRYIFCKAYYFCIWAFKEKDTPWIWAGMTTSMIIVGTVITLLQLIEVLMLPSRINIYGEYHGYFSLGMAVVIVLYVKQGDRYLNVLETCKKLSEKRRKVLRYISIVYLLILFASFFWSGYLIREYNLSH